MIARSRSLAAVVDVAAASRCHPDSFICGDAALAIPTPSGALLAVADGIGHGEEAATAASLALTTVRERAGDDLEAIIDACHTALRRSRGCVIGLAAIDERGTCLRWLGVGNVEGALWTVWGEQRRLISRPGIVGIGRPPLHVEVVSFAPADVLVMASDGIASAGLQRATVLYEVAELAKGILADHARADDDALVLVARRQLPWREAELTPA